jgi:pimeloyl-ACP methyl ester carboxylesterase
MLSGTFDAATPTSWAEHAATGLPNSRLLRFPGVGHTVVSWSECAQSVMLDFLNQPTGGYDTGCLDTLAVPPFDTSK